MAPRSAALLLLVSLSASTCLAGMDCSAAQAGQEECAADAGADSGSLMQVRRARLQGEGLQGSGGDEAAAWVADSFGPCLEDCGPMRFRDVTCRSVYEDAALPPGACTLAKPATAKSCNCGVVVCEKAAGGQCPQASTAADSAPAGPVEVGCYSTASLALEPGEPLMPLACENWTSAGPCSGGLPFYRFGDAAMSLGKCEAFCLGKGLDVFGIESGIACRCGASALNHAIWHEEKPRPGLAFDPSALEPSTATACPLKVYRYGGHYESGGVPRAYWNFLEGDLEYTDSIVQGRAIDEGTEEDGSPPEGAMPDALAQAEGDLKYNPNDPTFERPCWPGNCGPGNGPWRTRSTAAPPGVQDVWKEYVLIDYWYEPGLDAKRKEAFEAAAEVWRNSTCINLVERSQKPSGAHYIKVGAYDTGSCYLSGMGWPSSWASAINLGWCNDLRYLGNMVHEIGHALGMNHEQKRPDATQKYHGHGPFLKIFWENVPSGWVYQYTADEGSYTGSADDGAGDPHAGYADYDFESIMHYSGGSRFDTIPADKERVLGNRLHLTQGDINQINDIYQCVSKPPCAGPDCPTPAPTPAPPPPTPAPPAAYELRSSGHCAKSVATLPECERAASALSLSDTTAEDDGQNFGAGYDPPFCYFEGNSLKFNADGSNVGPCSEADRCLCSLVPTPAPTPAPPARASGACSFEALETSGSFCGLWRQGTQDTFDWTRKDGSTPSYGTGPSSAADGSYYVFIETSDPRLPGDTAVLESPPLIIDGPTAMSFQYHMHGRDVGSLKVRVKGGAEADAKEVWSKAGQVGDRWESATVSLDAYNGSTAQISFVAERGTGWEGDIAIDNVAFQASAPPATSTAAPTPSPTPSPTPAPTTATVAPTPSPTSPPTLAPTPSPTSLPTPSPTPSPTPRPTPSPTPLATPSPTPLPTPSPTPLPTPSPTPRPTPSPTPRPTPSPTPSPTPAPTPPPMLAPTAAPTPATPSPASGPSYERRTSGTCERRIKTAAECGVAAAALGFASTTAHDDLQPDGVSYDPPYCYYEGGLLKFNPAGRNTGACSDFDVCLCSLGPTPAPTLAPTIPALGTCGFEHNATTSWCGRWFNVQGEDQFDWLPLQGETPSYGTGPPHAYEGQQYVYMEASYPRASGQTAILRTVPLSVSGPIVMKFHYYMYGGDMGSLQVLVRKTSEAHVQEAWKVQGDQGDAWKTATVDLEPYVGSDVEVSLVGEVGSSYRSDIAIDSVAFEEE